MDCSPSKKALLLEKGQALFSVRRQAELLNIARSTVYRKAQINAEDLELMRKIDEIYTKRPFYGSRRIAVELKRKGYQVGRKQVRTLMKKLGLQAVYPKPKISIPHPEHEKHPYLLRNLEIIRVNQVWGTDTSPSSA